MLVAGLEQEVKITKRDGDTFSGKSAVSHILKFGETSHLQRDDELVCVGDTVSRAGNVHLQHSEYVRLLEKTEILG
jgi:hypothetical protein